MDRKTIEILLEDDALILPVKPPLVNSEHTPDQAGLPDLLALQIGKPVFPIHRLDFGVGGLLLCAKTQKAAALLSRALAEGNIEKEYLALAHGRTPESGDLTDLLFYDRRAGKSFVVDRMRAGVKAAELSYLRVGICESPWGELSLLRVRPKTGRTHQIRVQFANAGYPLLGDRKYGARETHPLGLYCTKLSFPHPTTGKEVSVESLPKGDAWDLFF